jgi:hypothetical protein
VDWYHQHVLCRPQLRIRAMRGRGSRRARDVESWTTNAPSMDSLSSYLLDRPNQRIGCVAAKSHIDQRCCIDGDGAHAGSRRVQIQQTMTILPVPLVSCLRESADEAVQSSSGFAGRRTTQKHPCTLQSQRPIVRPEVGSVVVVEPKVAGQQQKTLEGRPVQFGRMFCRIRPEVAEPVRPVAGFDELPYRRRDRLQHVQ